MGRALRFMGSEFEAVELTWRCMQGRFLLRPGFEANRRLVGVLARGVTLFAEGDVRIYFAGGTCNHIHIVAAFRSVRVKAAWTCFVRTNVSKELGDLFGWPGCHWERRSTDIPIVDDEALYERLVYLAGQVTRAGLVRRAVEWPGVPWIEAVTEGKRLVGVWYDRTRLYRLRLAWAARPKGAQGRRPGLGDVEELLELELTPPPMWAELAPSTRRARWQGVVASAEARWPVVGRVVGRARLARLDPHGKPETSNRSTAPACHAGSRQRRLAWWVAYRAFVETYRQAMEALRMGLDGCGFPAEGCLPVRMGPAAGG